MRPTAVDLRFSTLRQRPLAPSHFSTFYSPPVGFPSGRVFDRLSTSLAHYLRLLSHLPPSAIWPLLCSSSRPSSSHLSPAFWSWQPRSSVAADMTC
jgi:hypothetical protein